MIRHAMPPPTAMPPSAIRMAGKGEREPNPFRETVGVLGSKGSDASVPLLGSTGFPGVVAAEEPAVSVGSVGAETLAWRVMVGVVG